MSTNAHPNCKIVPLPASDLERAPQPPDTHENRVAKIRAEVSEIMRKAGKSVPPNDLPPLPDKLPGPGDQPQDPVDIHNLIEVRKKAAKLPAIENTADLLKEQMNGYIAEFVGNSSENGGLTAENGTMSFSF